MILDRTHRNIAGLSPGVQRIHSVIDIAVEEERQRITIRTAAIDHATQRRAIAAARPAGDHVAEIDYESVWSRRHADPAAIRTAHLPGPEPVLPKEMPAKTVCAPAPFCPSTALGLRRAIQAVDAPPTE